MTAKRSPEVHLPAPYNTLPSDPGSWFNFDDYKAMHQLNEVGWLLVVRALKELNHEFTATRWREAHARGQERFAKALEWSRKGSTYRHHQMLALSGDTDTFREIAPSELTDAERLVVESQWRGQDNRSTRRSALQQLERQAVPDDNGLGYWLDAGYSVLLVDPMAGKEALLTAFSIFLDQKLAAYQEARAAIGPRLDDREGSTLKKSGDLIDLSGALPLAGRVKETNMDKWARHGIVPLFDLLAWSRASGRNLTGKEIAAAMRIDVRTASDGTGSVAVSKARPWLMEALASELLLEAAALTAPRCSLSTAKRMGPLRTHRSPRKS